MAGDQSIFATITFNACVCPLALLALEYLRTRYVDIYSPLSRSRGGEVPSARFLGWVPQVLALSDDRMLQLAGLDGYVLLRFLRFGFRLCFVCSLGSAVLLPLYYHAEHFGDTAGTGTDLISSLSMGHVAMDGALLWAPFFFMYAFTGAFLYLIHQEYDNFVLARNKFLKSNFHTHQQPLSEQTQTEHTVRVVNLPANYTSHKLAAFFEAFYPGEVLFAHVVRPAPALEYWAAQRGRAQRQLEDAVARREAGASTTRMRMGRSGGQVRGGWECCPSGAYRLVDSPRGEAEEVDAVTYWADQLLLACVEVAAQQREVRAQEEEIDRRDGIEGAAGPSTGAGAGAGAGASVKAQGTSALVEAGAAEAGVREVKGKGQKGKEEKGGKGDKHWRPWSRAKKNAVPVLTPTVTATGTATATGTGAGVGGGTGAGGGGSRLMFEMGSILAGDRGTDQYGDRDRDGGRDYGERGGYGDGEVGEYGDGEDVYTFGGGPVGTGYTADADEGDADMEGVGGQGGQGQGGRGMGMFGGLGGLGLGLLTHKAGGTGAYAAGAGKAKGNMGKASVNNMGSVGNLGNLGNMGWVGGSQCGFVTFSTRRAQITATRLGMFSESHPHLRVLPAPSPSDILWENQSVSPERVQGMALITGGAFYFALGGWSVVLAFVAALSNLQTFEGLIPQLRQLRILGGLPYALLQGLLPVLVLMVLNGVIGGVLRGVAEGVERRQSRSEVQLRVFRWMFVYQLYNLYLILAASTATAGTSLLHALGQPQAAVESIGAALPLSAGLFLNYIITSALGGLPLLLLKQLDSLHMLLICSKDPQSLTRGGLKRGPLRDEEVDYSTALPDFLYILAIVCLFWVIAPLAQLAGGMFFAGAYIAYKYKYAFMLTRRFESGGQFWYGLYSYSMTGLLASTVLGIAYMGIKGAPVQAPLLAPLPLIVLFCWRATENQYKYISLHMPLESAILSDTDLATTLASDADLAFSDLYQPPSLRLPALAYPYPHRIGGKPLLEGGSLGEVYVQDIPAGEDPASRATYCPPTMGLVQGLGRGTRVLSVRKERQQHTPISGIPGIGL